MFITVFAKTIPELLPVIMQIIIGSYAVYAEILELSPRGFSGKRASGFQENGKNLPILILILLCQDKVHFVYQIRYFFYRFGARILLLQDNQKLFPGIIKSQYPLQCL